MFVYGRSYLDRENAGTIYEAELPLRAGAHEPINGLNQFSCLRDAAPDAWGRRIIESRLFGRGEVNAGTGLDEATYMLNSGSDRAGSLDFQRSATEYSRKSKREGCAPGRAV